MSLSSCNTDPLCYDHPHVGDFTVRFDWSKCPDARPTSMAAYFYSPDPTQQHVRYIFPGRDGGNAHLACGDYMAIGLNSDHTDWSRIRFEHDIEAFEIYTDDVMTLSALGIDVRSLPPNRASDDERMAMTPGGMLFSHRLDDVTITESAAGSQTVTFYPEEATCHYSVTITGVENIKYLGGGQIDATISGMAEGYRHGKNAPTDKPVTMPFLLTPDTPRSSMHGEFLTFGSCADPSVRHTVTVYVIFEDNSARFYNYDVTDQVAGAPDPHRVDIVIDGLSLPKPIVNGGGFRPDVADWIGVTEDIEM